MYTKKFFVYGDNVLPEKAVSDFGAEWLLGGNVLYNVLKTCYGVFYV